jgi:flagellar hook-associated protein 1 FlgK
MATLFGALAVGNRGLQAQQYAAQVIGSNITNANIEGYHREDPWLTSGAALVGIQSAGTKRAGQLYLEQNLNAQSATAGFSDARAQQLVSLQNTVADIGSSGLSQALDGFFSSLRAMEASPSDLAVRSDVLGRAAKLTSQINQSAQTLQNQREQVDGQVKSTLADINVQIRNIAQLNSAVGIAIGNGNSASDLQDQRDLAVNQLAQQAGARISEDADGGYAISLAQGITVVHGASASVLGGSPQPSTGLTDVVVPNTDLGALNGRFDGSLGGLLQVRDTDIVAAQNLLDQFTYDMASAFNAVHTGGVDLAGNPGLAFFTPPSAVSGSASVLSLNSALVGSPVFLAAALTGSPGFPVPGDNGNATLLSQQQNALVANSNTQTLNQAFGRLVSTVGTTKQLAEVAQTQSHSLLRQATNLREQQSGTNVAEQINLLTQYQRGHQAAARYLSVIDDMLSTLMSI